MRLWTIHPSYLDSKGLVALWRESLLAQNVLQGKTRGYTNHPQLLRFKECGNPLGAIAEYLMSIFFESERRGYHFDRGKIKNGNFGDLIDVSDSQVEFELNHLAGKLKIRDILFYEKLLLVPFCEILINPLFHKIEGDLESWEKGESAKEYFLKG